MKFLVDECFPKRLAANLQEQGHEVHFAVPGSSDAAVLELANQLEASLLTEDADFGALAVRDGRPHFGVLLLRVPTASLEDKADAVRAALPELVDRKFVVRKGSRQRSR